MIKLINDFYIKVSPDQYILIKIKEGKKKDGQPTEVHHVYGYFGTIKHCLKECVRQCFAEDIVGETVSFSEAIERLTELTERIERLIPEGVDK